MTECHLYSDIPFNKQDIPSAAKSLRDCISDLLSFQSPLLTPSIIIMRQGELSIRHRRDFCMPPWGKENMGAPNNALKAYMSRPDRIRSVLEYYLGEKLPDDWACEETGGFVPVRDANGKLSFRERDFLGKARAWGFQFLLGLENQETVNLTYPWRLMEMDCLTYGRNIDRIQERNTTDKVHYGSGDDFKYRYKREDRLEPVFNLMLYWGRKQWTGPLCLKDMSADISALPEKLQDLAGDYRVHLISMRNIPEKDLQKMDSDLKYVLGILNRTASAKQYRKYIQDNRAYFSRIPRSAVHVIDSCTNIKKFRDCLQYQWNQDSGEEEADMCKALDDIEKYAMKKGRKQGQKQGERSGTLKTLFSLVNDGLVKPAEAARRAKLPEAEFCREMKKAGYS